MFDLFRSRAKAVRYLLGAMLLLVALSMVVTLIPGFNSGMQTDSQVVAEVGKQALTLQELQQNVQAQIQGRQFPTEMAPILVPQIANQMITEYAVAYQAERMGFQVTEADMATAIHNILPQLFNGDQFAGRDVYAAALAQQNMTIPQFESALRMQLQVGALVGLAQRGVVVTPKEVADQFHSLNDKAKIEFAAISAAKYRAEISIKPEELKAFYERNRSGYQLPEKRSLEILVVDQAKLAQALVLPDEELRKIYEQNKDSYRVAERVHIRHILLKTVDKPKDELPKLAAKADDLLKQLKQGGDFAELAKKNSEDTASAVKGGDLGWVVHGQTVKAFEEAAFALKPKEISKVVTTEYGLHILQVLEKEDAHLRPFEEVKAQLADERKKQLVFDRMQTLSDQARAALVKDPKSAEKVARELELQLVKADKIGATDPIPEIGASRELGDAVSSLRKGEVSPVVQVAPTKLAAAVVTDVFPARQAELAEVEGQIRERLTAEKLGQLLDQRANELVEKVKQSNGDLKKAAQSMGLDFKTPPEFTRQGAIEGLGSASSLQAAFSAPLGDILKPVTVGDQRFVCKVVGRTAADESDMAAQRDSLLEQLKSQRAREHVELFEEGIRDQLVKQGKVKIHQDVINRLVSSYRGS